MKLKITQNVDVDIEKTRINEIWPKYLQRNDILRVDKIESVSKDTVNLVLDDGDTLLNVPNTVYSVL